MKTFGFNVSNDVFAENSWYFRNALVRSNYNNIQNGIHATTEFLEMFFENLLLDSHHSLSIAETIVRRKSTSGYHAQMYYPQDRDHGDAYDMVKYDFESIREIE